MPKDTKYIMCWFTVKELVTLSYAMQQYNKDPVLLNKIKEITRRQYECKRDSGKSNS